MGTTRTALQSKDGVSYQIVIAIEGYPYLLTDGTTTDATTAWSGTEWSSALSGLTVQWDWEQRFRPWDPDIQVDGLSFSVMDADNADTFGKHVFGTNAGAETYLTSALPAYSAVTTIPGQATASFDSSGTIWIGIEAITYTGKTSTTFTGCTRGRYAPFKANTETAQRYGREHPLPQIGDGQGTVIKPKITSLPRVWRGRSVGVWLHRRVGSTLDTKAEAQLVWMGRIREVRDLATGETAVDCEDYRARFRECVLLNDQFSCRIREGLQLKAGDQFNAKDNKAGTVLTATPLTVVSGTPSGPNQIAAGTYTLDSLADAFNQWWSNEKSAGRLSLTWTWYPRTTTNDDPQLRSRFRWTNGSTSGANGVYFNAPRAVQKFIGFEGVDFAGQNTGGVIFDSQSTFELASPETPYRILVDGFGPEVGIEDIRGTWFNNQPFWPSAIGPVGTTQYSFAVLQLNNGPMAVFHQVDSETLQCDFDGSNGFLDEVAGVRWVDESGWSESNGWRAIRADVDGEIRLRQVGFISGKLSTVLTKIMASTGTTGYNHGSYDVLPSQLGAAIPWELLGSPWTTSISNLAESHGQGHGSLLLVMEKPTKLSEAIACELAARMSTIVLKPDSGGSGAGGFRVATWGTPLAAQATHSLTVSNKASPMDAVDDQVTVANETDEALVNVIKLEYNRSLKGGYKDSITIRHAASIRDLGVEKALTISMRNTYAARQWTSESIDELTSTLVAALPMFAYPLRTLKRTVDISLYEGIAPGDFGTITDSDAREPTTGARGISSKASLLISHRVDWGNQDSSAVAEVEVLILSINSIAAYAPCAELDETAPGGGYDGSNSITLHTHSHSLDSENTDAESFNDGDAVEILQLDPDDPATALRWTASIDEVADSTHITLDTTLPGFVSTYLYRIRSQSYTSAVTTQRTKVYQADDADGMIADSTTAYTFGQNAQQGGTWENEGYVDTGAELAALYSTYAYGDGVAYDTGYERDLARLSNNLVNYRTAINIPWLQRTTIAAGTSGFERRVIAVLPIAIGPFALGPFERFLRVRPFLRRASAGAYVKLYATLCRRRPLGYSFTTTDSANPQYVLVGPKTATGWWETASTSFNSFDYGYLDFTTSVLDPLTGTGYLVLEAEPNVEIKGTPMIFLRALTTLS